MVLVCASSYENAHVPSQMLSSKSLPVTTTSKGVAEEYVSSMTGVVHTICVDAADTI